uniref:Uncharacterized protein n=1 Tax=Bubo bubo TaxID=30461 RepID=A0A8C0I7L7_BUBBB
MKRSRRTVSVHLSPERRGVCPPRQWCPGTEHPLFLRQSLLRSTPGGTDALHCHAAADCANGADEDNCGNGWLQILGDTPGVLPHAAGLPWTLSAARPLCLPAGLELVPAQCGCRARAVDCTQQDLASVPWVSSNVSRMDLKKNKIHSLLDNQFARYQSLKKL